MSLISDRMGLWCRSIRQRAAVKIISSRILLGLQLSSQEALLILTNTSKAKKHKKVKTVENIIVDNLYFITYYAQVLPSLQNWSFQNSFFTFFSLTTYFFNYRIFSRISWEILDVFLMTFYLIRLMSGSTIIDLFL